MKNRHETESGSEDTSGFGTSLSRDTKEVPISERQCAQKQAMHHADMVHIRHFHQVDMKLATKPSSLEGSHEAGHETSNETALKNGNFIFRL